MPSDTSPPRESLGRRLWPVVFALAMLVAGCVETAGYLWFGHPASVFNVIVSAVLLVCGAWLTWRDVVAPVVARSR